MATGKGKDVNNGEDLGHEGKFMHIASITGGAPRVRNSSKGIVKRKIVKQMAINKKKENTYTKGVTPKILI